MKPFFLAFVLVVALTTASRAQIPATWTQEKLEKLYGGAVTITNAKSHIKGISFAKESPQVFHGGECFYLMIMVLRGPGAPELKPDSADVKVVQKGNAEVWIDSISGYSVDSGSDGLHFSARRDGVVQLTGKVVAGQDGDVFVLTSTNH
jgi:hypothetical protein